MALRSKRKPIESPGERRANHLFDQYFKQPRLRSGLRWVQPHDKRCAHEARLENDDPLGVSHEDENVEKAIRGACDKLKTMLDARVEKQRGY